VEFPNSVWESGEVWWVHQGVQEYVDYLSEDYCEYLNNYNS